ncbi:MAG: beta-lactamase family protein [Bacteroidales bacterium]|nr:beta-lactamase family protein [Bacteroidales bacterium]
MDYNQLKIYLLLSLVFTVSIVVLGFNPEPQKENKPQKEIVSRLIKDEIKKIFYQDKAKIIDSIMQQKRKKAYFNGSVLVAYKGKCIYNKSFGYADLRKRRNLKENDIFQLASVSKQFTAMAIMILKEQNRLSYDDTVTKYIPEFPYPQITVRMLLNHTSGLPNYYWLVEHHWNKKEAPLNEDVIKLLSEYKLGLYFTPGKRWDYSNTGYVVLASIVERISGNNFCEFMQQNIFDPLQMKNTFVYSSSVASCQRKKLKGYYYRGRRYREIPETINDGTVGDKGVYSTTADLFKWDRALYSNILVSKETMQEAISTFKLRDKYEIPYGFGFRIKKHDQKKIAYHHGKWNGFRTSMLRYVEDTNTIIILNHTSSSLNNSIIREIQKVIGDTSTCNTTQEVIATILDEGLMPALKYLNNENLVLDTVKLIKVSQILYKSNSHVAARRLGLFNQMCLQKRLY